AVTVESVGIAEQSGGKGQRVRVVNARSGDALSARVLAADVVEAMP
ncbi:MAG: Chaperone for flagella basal body P-ring formation, partial [Nevskia sp.]|nr:Chaperone for flagella basal body P-ring formation [Nevskia sp.]